MNHAWKRLNRQCQIPLPSPAPREMCHFDFVQDSSMEILCVPPYYAKFSLSIPALPHDRDSGNRLPSCLGILHTCFHHQFYEPFRQTTPESGHKHINQPYALAWDFS